MAASDIQPMFLHLIRNRHLLFATDLVHFLSREYQTGWMPTGFYYYIAHPLTTFTNLVGDAARVLIANRDRQFREKFLELVPPGTRGSTGLFAEHARNVLFTFFVNQGSIPELFDTLIYLSRLSILFHQRGYREAPDLAVIILGEGLLEYERKRGPGLYCSFNAVAADIIAGFPHHLQ